MPKKDYGSVIAGMAEYKEKGTAANGLICSGSFFVFHVFQGIFAALKDQQIKGYIIFLSQLVQPLKQGLRKSDGTGNIGVFKFVFNPKHRSSHIPLRVFSLVLIVTILDVIYITIYGCILE